MTYLHAETFVFLLDHTISPNQPFRSIHFANSSMGETVRASPAMITQSMSWSPYVPKVF